MLVCCTAAAFKSKPQRMLVQLKISSKLYESVNKESITENFSFVETFLRDAGS